jgi:exodeoxyribonuclease VII large subunit
LDPEAIFTVTQLTAAIKQKLEGSFPFLSVRGEVSNLRHQASGHTYFTLKDAGAQISAVLFRGNSQNLTRKPKEGDQIVAKGELSVYPPRGNYQMLVRTIEYSGVGELLQQLHALKIKLETKGWLRSEIKKPLPKLPKKIGVITSPTGSVIQDILHILSRRFSGFQLILYPVKVQGEGAAEEIARAIDFCNQYQVADVLIVGRGGGSLEDLWPFNEERVAEAIFHSKIPIISAVGHETDFTIADFVADLRAPTPSAAAEMVTQEKNQLLLNLQKAKARATQGLQAHLRTHKQLLQSLRRQPPLSSPYTLLGPYLQKIDEIQEDVDEAMRRQIVQWKLRLNGLQRQKEILNPQTQLAQLKLRFTKSEKELLYTIRLRLKEKKERLAKLIAHLRAIDPRNLLKKGYSIVFHEKSDSVILSTSKVEPGDRLRVQLSDGKLLVNIEEKL